MTKLSLVLFAGGLLAASTGAAGQRNGGNRNNSSNAAEGLHLLAVKAGKLYFGTASETNNFADAAYMQVLNNTNELGLVVPENSLKWQSTEPRQDQFTFSNSDRVAGVARANSQMFRCHTLTWFQQLPNFVQTTQWTKETLTAAIETHISNVVGHYAGQCYAWDVVNEAINENGTFRNSVFFETLGTDFIPISFRAAAAADPAAKLYYNDFNIESAGNKSTTALDIVRLLQDQGVRIDGVGFQAHFTVGRTPARQQLATQLKRFTALGMEVSYTELDVRHTSLPTTANQREQQARDYVSVVGACLDVPACVGIVVWQFTDKYSWIPNTFTGQGDACLWDANMTKKAAYTSVSSLLKAAATSSTAAASSGVAATRPASVAAATSTPSSFSLSSSSLVGSAADSLPGSGGPGLYPTLTLNGVLCVSMALVAFGMLMM